MIRECPSCGQLQGGAGKYCSNCGTFLGEVNLSKEMPDTQEIQMDQNQAFNNEDSIEITSEETFEKVKNIDSQTFGEYHNQQYNSSSATDENVYEEVSAKTKADQSSQGQYNEKPEQEYYNPTPLPQQQQLSFWHIVGAVIVGVLIISIC